MGDYSKRPDSKWTVMIFMEARSATDFPPLAAAAEADVTEMKSAPTGDSLQILVQRQHDRKPYGERCRIGDEFADVPDAERSDDKLVVLKNFIKWAVDTSEKSWGTSRHLMLVLWGHAYQFAFGQTTEPSTKEINALNIAAMSGVLKGVREMGQPYASLVLDVIGFDACDLATLEVCYQLQPYANYLVASEMGIPIPGWPYDRAFGRGNQPPQTNFGAAELGAYIVRRYCESYRSERAVSLTLLDLKQTTDVATAAGVLAQRICEAIVAEPLQQDVIKNLFMQSQTQPGKPFVDVADLCLNLIRGCSDALVVGAAQDLGDLLISPNPVPPEMSFEGTGRPFVQEHGRNAATAAKLNGVCLYAPHVDVNYEARAARAAYERLELAMRIGWSDLVHNLAGLNK